MNIDIIKVPGRRISVFLDESTGFSVKDAFRESEINFFGFEIRINSKTISIDDDINLSDTDKIFLLKKIHKTIIEENYISKLIEKYENQLKEAEFEMNHWGRTSSTGRRYSDQVGILQDIIHDLKKID